MTREIKFRAWDNGMKVMLKVNALDWFSNSRDKRVIEGNVSQVYAFENPSVGDLYNSAGAWNYELMQFTGLKDKNGKEIYEGDIVTTPKCDSPRVVRYAAPEFHLYKGMGDDIDTLVDCDSFTTPMAFEEVIGNIYENPELLK